MHRTLLVVLVSFAPLAASPQKVKVRVAAGKYLRHSTPTVATIKPAHAILEAAGKNGIRCTARIGNAVFPAQVELVLGSEDLVRVHWLTAALAAGQKSDVTLELEAGEATSGWKLETPESAGFTELSIRGRKVHRHVTAYDPKRPNQTYKPFLHVYDLTGSHLITKGPGGTYTHHRGIFLGWNRVSYGEGGKHKADFWHCKGVTIRHQKFVPTRSKGGVFHEVISNTHWIDGEETTVVRERRRVRTYCCGDDKTILDFSVTLEAIGSHPVRLNGDGHHAGFQFRAPQEAHRNSKQTVYVRPTSAAKQKNDMWGDCAWTLCRYKLGGKQTSVMYITAPTNPTPAVMSTRPYARFGSFFKTVLQPKKPLHLRYRVIILRESAKKPLDIASLQALYDDFANPLRGEPKR